MDAKPPFRTNMNNIMRYGWHFNALQDAKGKDCNLVLAYLQTFMELSDLLGFDYPKGHFESFRAQVNQHTAPFKHIIPPSLPADLSYHLQMLINPLSETTFKKAGSRNLAELSAGIAPQELQTLDTKLKLTAAHALLRVETLYCLEIGAYRSAAVMGWNLAYDYIRQWAFDNHKTVFSALKEPINDYADFMKGSPSEANVIEICFSNKLFTNKLHHSLIYHLRLRNEYAHPSDKISSPTKINAYIVELIDTIIRPPFK